MLSKEEKSVIERQVKSWVAYKLLESETERGIEIGYSNLLGEYGSKLEVSDGERSDYLLTLSEKMRVVGHSMVHFYLMTEIAKLIDKKIPLPVTDAYDGKIVSYLEIDEEEQVIDCYVIVEDVIEDFVEGFVATDSHGGSLSWVKVKEGKKEIESEVYIYSNGEITVSIPIGKLKVSEFTAEKVAKMIAEKQDRIDKVIVQIPMLEQRFERKKNV